MQLDTLIKAELAFLDIIFHSDCKNYHAWSHKIWLVERFELWNDDSHLEFIEDMLDKDVRNNSVWSFRYFIMVQRFNHEANQKELKPVDYWKDEGHKFVENEAKYIIEKRLPDNWTNEAAWAYLRGFLASTQHEEDQSLNSNARLIFITRCEKLAETID